MYPFGSGMPQPTSQSSPSTNNNRTGIPFGAGAGWVAQPTHTQQYPSSGYPPAAAPTNQQVPYPTHNPNPHAAYPQHQHQSPYPSSGMQYGQYGQPPNSNPYPPSSTTMNTGSPYPVHSQHYPQSYPSNPPSGYPSSQPSGYPSQQSAYPSQPSAYPSQPSAGYPSSQQLGYPFSQQSGHPSQQSGHHFGHSNAPAANMAQCFSEMKSHHQNVVRKEGTPTVVAEPNFDAVKDAHDLRKAMKGFGTDENTLINIICRRSNEQRQEIQRQFKTHFGKDLIEDIKSETSGNFEKLLVGLLRPIVDFYCTEICDAMAGLGTDEDVLIEILCTLSNFEIHTIKNAYLRMYGAHLESELKSETSGNFKRLLVSLCTAARDESGNIDPVAAQHDARELLKAGELRVGTDESTFNMILCQRNYQQLKLIFQEYEKMTGHTLDKAMKKEFSGDILEGLRAIYKCVTNKSEYFATRLHKSMAGIGTNDNQLIRVIITRSEIDLHDIKVTFEKLYGKSLRSWVKGDTSGHYKHALYVLIGEERSS